VLLFPLTHFRAKVPPASLTDILFLSFFYRSINVPPTVDEALATWCETQRIRRKVTLSDKGDAAAAAAGEGTLTDSRANPLTKEQFQLLESIGFETVPPKRKRNYTPPTVDRAEVERKWEEKLYVVMFSCITSRTPQSLTNIPLYSQELIQL
jgi:hypothetical protein